jgi:hypothetical protein
LLLPSIHNPRNGSEEYKKYYRFFTTTYRNLDIRS